MGVVVDLARLDADAVENEDVVTVEMFIIMWVGDDPVGSMPVGGALANDDEWGKERKLDWAEALIQLMPVDDDITRITLHHMDDVLREVSR